jgi:hypothetical protein
MRFDDQVFCSQIVKSVAGLLQSFLSLSLESLELSLYFVEVFYYLTTTRKPTAA